MRAIAQKFKSFLSDERGAAAVEYGLFVAAISAVIVGVVVGLGQKINTAFTAINTTLPGV